MTRCRREMIGPLAALLLLAGGALILASSASAAAEVGSASGTNREAGGSAAARNVVPASSTCPAGQPAAAFWAACLTVGVDSSNSVYGYFDFRTVSYGALSPADFTVDSVRYSLDGLTLETGITSLILSFTASPGMALQNWVLQIGSRTYDLSDAALNDPALYDYAVGPAGFSWDSEDIGEQVSVSLLARPPNNAPTVANPIRDQEAEEGLLFRYQFPEHTFADEDSEDTLRYAAALESGSGLPVWLDFTAATRTFSGTPPPGSVGTLQIEVTADDGSDDVSDVFALRVNLPSRVLRFSEPLYRVNEPDGNVTATVEIVDGGGGAAMLSQAVTLRVRTAGHRSGEELATAGQDYTGVDTTVTIGVDASSAEVIVPIRDDGLVEKPQYFRLDLAWEGTAPEFTDAVVTLGSGPWEVRIDSEDVTVLTLDRAVYEVVEGQAVDMVLSSSLAIEFGLSMRWSVSHATVGTLNGDLLFVSGPGNVMDSGNAFEYGFPAGASGPQPAVQLRAVVNQDAAGMAEGPEAILITVMRPSGGNGGITGLPLRATIHVFDVSNADPVFVSAAMQTVAENTAAGVAVLAVSAEDLDASDAVRGYRLSGGADRALFALDAATGALSFRSAPDFELPADAGGDNAYEVEVEVTSGTGLRERTAVQRLTVLVMDVRPTEVALSALPSMVSEGATMGQQVSVTASWVGGETLPMDTEVQVTVGDHADGAASDTDYAAVAPFTLTIKAGMQSGTGSFPLSPTDDELVEGDEGITVSGVASGFTVQPATLLLLDDDRPVISLDLSLDGTVDERDAAVLYYAYLRGVLLYPSLGGQALFRSAFFSRLVAVSNRNDAFYLRLLEGAAAVRGRSDVLDLNEDGTVDERDAAVLYYAYLRGVLLYPSLGGQALFRSAFFSRLVAVSNRNDAFYLQMLERAAALRGDQR